MWEFKNGIKLNSQIWVQSKVNLHKPKKKKVIKLKAKWCMDKPWTNQITKHTITQISKEFTFFLIIYYMINNIVYIEVANVLKNPKWEFWNFLILDNYDSYNFLCLESTYGF